MRKFTTAISIAALTFGVSGAALAGALDTGQPAAQTPAQLAQAEDHKKQVAPNPGSETEGRKDEDRRHSEYPRPETDSSEGQTGGNQVGENPSSDVENDWPDKGETYPADKNAQGIDRD